MSAARRGARFLLLAGAAALGAHEPEPAGGTPGIPVTRLSFAEPGVEVAGPDGVWRALPEGGRVRTGERLRTRPDGVARLDFPFMGLSVGPDSEVAIPAGVVLSVSLLRGRVELGSERSEIIKLTTPEVEIRGQGRVVVRRDSETSLVMAMSGAFRVQGRGQTVTIARGQGTRARAGQAPGPAEPLPAAPGELRPGSDPQYFHPGDEIELRWAPAAAGQHLQVLGVDSDVVVMNHDVGPPPYVLRIPWAGMFRWRVAARDERGFESLPSAEGLVCLLAR